MDAVIKTIAVWVGSLFWLYLMQPLVWLLELEFELLKLVSRYNNFSSEAGVILGWIALRDLSNMFFILVLLVIGFATILRISNYGYQQLLRRTIIIAILINFSKTIVGFIIDIAQVIMLTFIAAVDEIMTGGLVVAIGLHDLFTLNPSNISNQPTWDFIISLVMGAALVAILLVVIGIIVMMLLMRIVALWVAIILSPLAFFANIFPATQSFYNQWLKQLGTNLVTGPMLAFFLWLTFAIVGNGEAYRSFMENKVGNAPTEFLGTSNMVNYIVSIAMLLMGIKVAAKSGAAGANFAAKGMGMIQNTASKLARRYPIARAKQLGAAVSRLALNDKGEFKSKTLGLIANKVPFYGGRSQRGLMKLQGVDKARQMAEFAEDTKYINPKQQEEYYKSKSRMARTGSEIVAGWIPRWAKDSKAGQRVGGAMEGFKGGKIDRFIGGASRVLTSAGSHYDAEVGAAIVRTDRKEQHTAEQASTDAKLLEKINDQPRTDALNLQWAHTIKDDAARKRITNLYSFKDFIKNQKAETWEDEYGQPRDGIPEIFRAYDEDVDTLGYDEGTAMLNLAKRIRIASTGAYKTDSEKLIEEMPDLPTAIEKGGDIFGATIDKKTGRKLLHYNNKRVIEPNSQQPLVKRMDGNLMAYPQNGIRTTEHFVGLGMNGIATGEYNFDNDFVENLDQSRFETDTEFDKRREFIKNILKENDKEFDDKQRAWARARNISEKEEDWSVQDHEAWDKSSEKKQAADKLFARRRIWNNSATVEDIKILDEDLKNGFGGMNQGHYNQLIADSALIDWSNLDKNEAARLAAKKEAPTRDKTFEKMALSRLSAEMSKVSSEQIKERAAKDKSTEDKARLSIEKEKYQKIKEDLQKNPSAVDKQLKADIKKFDSIMEAKVRGYVTALEAIEKNANVARLSQIASKISDKRDDSGEAEGTLLRSIEEKEKKAKEKGIGFAELETKDPEYKLQKENYQKLLAEQKRLEKEQKAEKRRALDLSEEENDFYVRSALKNATDGMNYARLQEMDIENPEQRELFIKLTKVATLDQERQLVMEGNPAQIRLFAKTITSLGRKPGKVVTDNLPASVQREVFTDLFIQRRVKEGSTKEAAQKEAEGMTNKQLKDETT